MFESLSDRLTGVLKDLRGKGRLSDADIDATCREIRLALLDADVALPVVRSFINKIKERAKGAEVHGALNPAQQVVKIVNDELVGILGGETRRLQFAKTLRPSSCWPVCRARVRPRSQASSPSGSRTRGTPRCWWRATSSVPAP